MFAEGVVVCCFYAKMKQSILEEEGGIKSPGTPHSIVLCASNLCFFSVGGERLQMPPSALGQASSGPVDFSA